MADNAGARASFTVAGVEIDFEAALAVVAGYCFGQETVAWSPPQNGVGDPPGELRRGAFAYGTYDCVPASPSPAVESLDVLVADGLNARLQGPDIAGVLAVAAPVSDQLARIDPGLKFWELTREQVSTQPVDLDTPADAMWRAWTLLMGVPSIDVARSHKILHHKRPSVFPLLDNETIDLLDRETAWAAIHEDLDASPAAWAQLEREVDRLARARGGASLTRLRLHDILLWTRATGRWDVAYRDGNEMLRSSARGDPSS